MDLKSIPDVFGAVLKVKVSGKVSREATFASKKKKKTGEEPQRAPAGTFTAAGKPLKRPKSSLLI